MKKKIIIIFIIILVILVIFYLYRLNINLVNKNIDNFREGREDRGGTSTTQKPTQKPTPLGNNQCIGGSNAIFYPYNGTIDSRFSMYYDPGTPIEEKYGTFISDNYKVTTLHPLNSIPTLNPAILYRIPTDSPSNYSPNANSLNIARGNRSHGAYECRTSNNNVRLISDLSGGYPKMSGPNILSDKAQPGQIGYWQFNYNPMGKLYGT